MGSHVNLMCNLMLSASCVACMSDGKTDFFSVSEGSKVPPFTVSIAVTDSADWRYDCIDIFDSSVPSGPCRIILFFDTKCSDCRKELPSVQEFYDRIKSNENAMLVCVSRGQQEDEILDYWKSNNLTLPYSAQPDRSIYELFASEGIPRIYLVDSDGIVRRVYNDSYLPSAAELTDEVVNMLQESEK